MRVFMDVLGSALVLLVAAFTGWLGGMGGAAQTVWQLRRRMADLAAAVDPEVASKVAACREEIRDALDAAAAAEKTAKSVAGQFGALVKSEKKIAADDLDFIVAAVSERLRQRVAHVLPKAAP
jgi:LDH2 family malate/lactate/ureidoglycolate dehydrogenase